MEGGDGRADDITADTILPANADRSIDEVVRRIKALKEGEFVGIGTPPRGALDHWPERLSDDVIYTAWRYHVHLHVHHPERAAIDDLLEHLVRAIRTPDAVAAQNDGRIQFIVRMTATLNVIVVVRPSAEDNAKNGILTVFTRGKRSTIAKLAKGGNLGKLCGAYCLKKNEVDRLAGPQPPACP